MKGSPHLSACSIAGCNDAHLSKPTDSFTQCKSLPVERDRQSFLWRGPDWPPNDQAQMNTSVSRPSPRAARTLMATVAAIRWLPEADEFPQAEAIQARHGSLQRAFALVKRVTGTAEWEEIARSRSEDLLVYLTLGRFRKPRR